MDFSEFNYIFISPEPLLQLFKPMYSNILKNALIFFPKDFGEAEKLLNDYENIILNKKKCILISPFDTLERNIKTFQDNKNILYLIGYCQDFNREHDMNNILLHFSKFYIIANSSEELVEQIFKLNIIFNHRKKQNYEIKNNINDFFELNDDNSMFLFDFNNDCSKNNTIVGKLYDNDKYKRDNDECYFSFIQSLALLNKYLEDQNYLLLFMIFSKFANKLTNPEDIKMKLLFAVNFLRNLHILFLYFSYYPYLFEAVTDDEINEILSKYKYNFSQDIILINEIFVLNSLIQCTNNLAFKINNGLSILDEKFNLKILQKLLIEIHCLIEVIYNNCYFSQLIEYYEIKNFLKDIDFCVGVALIDIIESYLGNDYPLTEKISQFYRIKEQRFSKYKIYKINVKCLNENKSNDLQLKVYNEAIKFKDTIVLGDKHFHNIISKMNLPCENIYYLNEIEFYEFFQIPKKLNNKYKKCRYFIIMNEKTASKYIETIKYIGNTFALYFFIIIFVQNENIKINKQLLQKSLLALIIAYNEKDIFNFYIDSNTRINELTLEMRDKMDEIDNQLLSGLGCNFPKVSETKITKEEDNGWDMVSNLDENIFNITHVISFNGQIDISKYTIDIYRVYKENNCLELFLNYYGNYFGGQDIVLRPPLLVVVKLFLYAYTLEENDGKSFYSLINNDLRSGNPEKICRYLPMLNNVHRMLKFKYLKSYCGDAYRATWFRKELINEIKPGKKMFNSSLWSSSKKISVARKFLFKYKKNILLHIKIKEGKNIDIHLEKLSQFPSEEEVLILPFCVFEVKSFKKFYENNLEYFNLELIYCEEENKKNKIENMKYNNIKI